MEHVKEHLLQKVLYGCFFVVVLPVTLAMWARGTSGVVQMDAVHSQLLGAAMAIVGAGTIAAGMLSLWVRGGGLPMNAFPPPRFVSSGPYSLVPHPIYGGFVLLCAGVAILRGSASALWLVTPTVTLACAALVMGYELPDLRQRFGPQPSPWLPIDGVEKPTLLERARVYLVVLLPWLLLYEAVIAIGVPHDAVSTFLPIESEWPVVEWTEYIYASTYVVVLLAPILIGSGRTLRTFVQRSLISMALIFPLFLLLPLFASPKRFWPTTVVGELLRWERLVDSAAAAFPSYHVVWALIAASALGEGVRERRWLWWTWAALVSVSCVTTGMHSLIDVVGGLIAFVLIIKAPNIWVALLRGAERLAASWKEWRFGPVRIINHGAYAGLAAFVGMLIISAFVGPNHTMVAAMIFVLSMIGAALWAQWVEGSPSLLRPLGFYGGMIGAMAGALITIPMGLSLWLAWASICVAAPWIQSIGRLRCLVQGCCHGRKTENVPGIRYTHPRSRVVRLTDLAKTTVHATQVYSILWNMVIGAALVRLLYLQASSTLICGVYLILSGAGRFVEEAYRGEPQTLVIGGLRLYQWVAIVTMVAGAVITALRGHAMPAASQVSVGSFLVAVACGVGAWFISGIDFPESSRRFARLT